jgi:hypothetical protein
MTKPRTASTHYYRFGCLLSKPFLPGTSLEPTVIPTAQFSSFRLQYNPYYVSSIPSITVSYIEYTECFPGMTSKFLLKTLVTVLVALTITGKILHFRFHIRFISMHNLLYLICFLLPFVRHFCLRILSHLSVCTFSAFCF